MLITYMRDQDSTKQNADAETQTSPGHRLRRPIQPEAVQVTSLLRASRPTCPPTSSQLPTQAQPSAAYPAASSRTASVRPPSLLSLHFSDIHPNCTHLTDPPPPRQARSTSWCPRSPSQAC